MRELAFIFIPLMAYFFPLQVQVYCEKDTNFLKDRTTMVHLFEWTWRAIALECETFLGPHGYGGVQISPAHEVRVGKPDAWWQRYSPISYILTSRSGDEFQLREMVTRCNRAGVRVYADVVINHMSGPYFGKILGTGGNTANYASRSFPAVPYTKLDFNPACDITDYQDSVKVRNCMLASLLDLNQTRPHVRDMIVNYMNKLLDVGVAGFRIDAAKHMWPNHLSMIYGNLHGLSGNTGFDKGTRPYIYQEVIDLDAEPIKSFEYAGLGDVTEFKYSRAIGLTFRRLRTLKSLKNLNFEWRMLPTKDALVFVDNHDNQRGHGAGGAEILTFKDGSLYQLAVVFMLAHPYGHVARVMSSYTFKTSDQGPPTIDGQAISTPSFLPDGRCNTDLSDWVCEHRWPAIANMVHFRNIVGHASLKNWWDNGRNQVAFSRGKKGFIAINNEMKEALEKALQTGLTAGVYCDVISGGLNKRTNECTGNKVKVGVDGSAVIALPTGPSALAIHIGVRLKD